MSAASIQVTLNGTLAQARARPADASIRMQLFRLFVITGQWERAANQLDVASQFDTELAFTVAVYRKLIAGERLRAEVFAGRRTPVIAGEPPQWLAWMIEALRADASAQPAQAAALRAQALEQAAAIPGQLNGTPFEWIADADGRLGPVIEAFIDGTYYWIPCQHLRALTIEAPTDWLDMVWVPAELTFASGGTRPAHLPARYPGSEAGDDDQQMSRKTTWSGSDEAGWRGCGQKLLTTDSDELGLLDVRELRFQEPTPGDTTPPASAPAGA